VSIIRTAASFSAEENVKDHNVDQGRNNKPYWLCGFLHLAVWSLCSQLLHWCTVENDNFSQSFQDMYNVKYEMVILYKMNFNGIKHL